MACRSSANTSISFPLEPTSPSAAARCILSRPQARHGARLPFDFLLRSLAEEYGERAICVILSGTGADGSLGLKAIKEKGGLSSLRIPRRPAFDGMPRSAILTGAVDLVLPLAGIPDALVKFHRRMSADASGGRPGCDEPSPGLAARDHRSSPGKNRP